MKKTWKLLLLALAVALLVGSFTILAFSEADAAEPSLQIKEFSLSLENAVYMNFKVSGENIKDVSEIKLLAWDEAPASYQKDTAEYVLATKGTEEETGYEQFQYTNLAAKDMTKMVYACAYYTDGETEVYSSPVKFSVAMYADMQKTAADPDEGLIVLIDQMLEYGAAAQTYFNYNTEFLATDEVHMVRVVNGKLSDGFTLGWYQEGAQITMTANEPAEGYAFSHWENSAGEAVGTEETVTVSVTKVDTYTAVYEEEISYFLYTELSDGTYGISANPEATLPAELDIPATYNGKAVTQIWQRGFVKQNNLISVIIPNSITSIEYNAFNGCKSLKNIVLSDNMKSIADFSFGGCSSLTSIVIPDSVTTIGKSAFHGCTNLTNVTLGNGVQTIDTDAFASCNNIQSVYISDIASWCGIDFASSNSNPIYFTKNFYLEENLVTNLSIPDGVKRIGAYAFTGYDKLTSVNIPDSVKSVGRRAFTGCTNVYQIVDSVVYVDHWAIALDGDATSINFRIGTIGIADGAFENQYGLTDVVLLGSIETIGSKAFYNCTKLSNITIFSGTKDIGDSAFYSCTSLNSIIIPEGVERIGSQAFYGCTLLGEVRIVGGLKSIEDQAFYNCSELKNITIPDSIRNISSNAFSGCKNLLFNEYENVYYLGNSENLYTVLIRPIDQKLETYTINETTKLILGYAFNSCSNLKNIVIPDSIAHIGSGAFGFCSELTDITLPSGLTTISSQLFSQCSNLTQIEIPASVESIEDAAFSYSGLESIEIPKNVTKIGAAFSSCSNLTTVTILNDMATIDNYAFQYCDNLKSVVLPKNLKVIGEYMFDGCGSLTNIIISTSVTSIGNHAFANCSSLTSITIPNSITSIGYSAFYSCSGLTSITIPNSVTSIDDWAFSGCSNLTDIYFTGTEEEWNAISKSSAQIPTTATIHYNYVLESDSSLFTFTELSDGTYSVKANPDVTLPAELVIPSTYNGKAVTQIEAKGFRNQTALTSVTIPDSVTSIGDYAFQECSNLTSITIPDFVTSIGTEAFYRCESLKSVTIPDFVTNIGEYAFYLCRRLTDVTIGNGITSIGKEAFAACYSLTRVDIFDLEAWCKISFANERANPLNNGVDLYLNGTKVTDLYVSDSVTSIGEYAFCGCSSLTSVTIPDSVTIIRDWAFYGCSNLKNVAIDNGVTIILNYVFNGCSSLTNVTIPDSVEAICLGAFMDCTNLTDIYFTGTEEEWNAIEKESAKIPTTATIHYNYVPESE